LLDDENFPKNSLLILDPIATSFRAASHPGHGPPQAKAGGDRQNARDSQGLGGSRGNLTVRVTVTYRGIYDGVTELLF
jgi:hypothetical protein